MKRMLFCYATFAVCAAMAGGLSSLTVGAYLDNNEIPAARVVDANGMAMMVIAGEWFDSGACELLVDGVLAATSDGAAQTYALAGAEGTWRTYRVTLRSAEGVLEKLVTLFPSANFSCSLHRLSVKNDFLDSAPAGTVRKIAFGETVPVAWSGMWNDGADGAAVVLYAGRGTGGTMLGRLVDEAGTDEGICKLASKTSPLPSGHYTLTHFDGVETLTAYLSVRSGGTVFTMR